MKQPGPTKTEQAMAAALFSTFGDHPTEQALLDAEIERIAREAPHMADELRRLVRERDAKHWTN